MGRWPGRCQIKVYRGLFPLEPLAGEIKVGAKKFPEGTVAETSELLVRGLAWASLGVVKRKIARAERKILRESSF